MDETEVVEYITSTFEDIEILTADGNSFIYYGPEHRVPEKTFPFATLVTNDLYDQMSDLGRPGVYRLNVGVSKATFVGLFGSETPGYDFTALDRLMPHPIYGNVNWLCVLSPSAATFETVKPLLAEAYDVAVRQWGRRAERGQSRS
jgi:hypothetical protein